ncbi:MAG: dinitrogenase iron-molybdenum cofactor family protein [Bacillota bacterium]|nr:dinitrogenase iron-molybdenum cofactor family protein [Bacillota bacterium]
MKICMPVLENKGLESMAYNHFGSAPIFLIYNTENNEVKVIENGDAEHEHGKCQPLKAIGNEDIDAVLVGGIGRGALTKLNSKNIKVYKAENDTLVKNVELLNNNKLNLYIIDDSCSGHHGHIH